MSDLMREIGWALPELRAAAESRMRSTFLIKRATGGYVWDPDKGEDVEEFEPLFTTKGRMKSTRTYGTLNQEAGGRTVTTVTRELHIPVDSPNVPPRAAAECIAVDDTSDPTLLGTTVRIAGDAPGDQTTARRFEVTEVIR